MKTVNKFAIILAVATFMAGAAVTNGAQPKTQNNERQESKSKERAEKKEKAEKSEAEESEQDQAALARRARINMEQARAIALERAPGNVEGNELERERGRLIYSFDIRNAQGTIDEVQVSAITGRIVRVEHENNKQEAVEKSKEEREKSKTRKP